MSTTDLLQTVGYPGFDGQVSISSRDLYTLARKNKIGSLYVRSLHDSNELGDLEEKWQNRADFQDRVARTMSLLSKDIPKNFKYSIVKSKHNFWADSKDIDIIVFEGDLIDLKETLVEKSYTFCGDSPTTFDVTHPETGIQLDAQSDFSLQNIVYFDKRSIEERYGHVKIEGTEVPVASKPDDLALIVIHSVTEQMFILKEYFAAIHALEGFSRSDFNRFIETVEVNNIGSACRAFFSIVAAISKRVYDRKPAFIDEILHRYPPYQFEVDALLENGIEVPHRYTRQTGLRTVVGKLGNRVFLKSAITQVPELARPQKLSYIGKELLLRREREHYVHDTSDM